jgi:hypothetical protein
MEIIKVNASQIYFSENDSNIKKFKLKISDNYDKVLNILASFDKHNLLNKLKTRNMKDKEFDIDFMEMPTYETKTSLLNNIEFDINYSDDNLINIIIEKLGRPKITKVGKTISCWYPKRNSDLYTLSRMKCIETYKVLPKYPIYIISLGRWEKRRTAKYLEKSNIDFKIVVEPDEYDEYAKVINPDKIIKCPENFSKKGCGGIPVRNFVWEHSISMGAKKHWILDDNIECYYRNNKCQNSEIYSGAVFRSIEDYSDRYENIKMSGHQYLSFCPEGKIRPPVSFNTRVFSSILLSNDIYPEFKWRGIYNEDVDLSIRLQKAGYVNMLSNFIICDKETTMKDKGGNTSTIYSTEHSHLKKAQALVDFHPDCVKVVSHKTRVWHHDVDFSKFQNKLQLKNDIILEDKSNDYGLIYVPETDKKRRTNTELIEKEIIEEPEIIFQTVPTFEQPEIIEESQIIQDLRNQNQFLIDENLKLKALLKLYI